jgi:hypothetical protein
MREHESDEICSRCGQEYGNHRWFDDACPTKKAVAYINDSRKKLPLVIFNPFRRFKKEQS